MTDFFPAAVEVLFREEGIYDNDPADPGGETAYGITAATARRHGYTIAQILADPSIAKLIYRKEFYVFDGLTSLKLACRLLSMSAHLGPRRAVVFAQHASGSQVDGWWGPETRDKVNRIDVERFLDRLNDLYGDYLSDRIVEDVRRRFGDGAVDATKLKYDKGWHRRARRRYRDEGA